MSQRFFISLLNIFFKSFCYRSLQAHEATIQAISFSPDCKYLLTSDTVGVLKLWKDLIEPVNDLVDSAVSCDTSESLVSIVEDAHDLGVTGSDFASTQETPGEMELQKYST